MKKFTMSFMMELFCCTGERKKEDREGREKREEEKEESTPCVDNVGEGEEVDNEDRIERDDTTRGRKSFSPFTNAHAHMHTCTKDAER